MRPLVGLRPPPFCYVLSLHLTMPTVSVRSVHDTIEEGVLSLCGCSLTLTLTTSIGIWHSAGATKSWFLVLSMSGSWLVSVIFGELPIRSLSAAVSLIEEFLQKVAISFENRSELSFFQWKMTWFGRQFSAFAHALCCLVYSSLHLCLSSTVHDTTPDGVLSSCGCSLTLTLTISTGIWHSAGVTKSWFLALQLSCSCRISWCVVNCFWIFSGPLFGRWLWSLLIRRRSQWKNSSTKWQSPWRIVEANRKIILFWQDDMVCPSVMIICSDSWILRLFICTRLSLFHSPRHDPRGRSLLMLVLSHSDTHHLNRHMIGYGCHEILIPCSTTVLFSATFPLIFYLSRWGWGWVHTGSLESRLRATIVSDET